MSSFKTDVMIHGRLNGNISHINANGRTFGWAENSVHHKTATENKTPLTQVLNSCKISYGLMSAPISIVHPLDIGLEPLQYS